MTSGRLQFDHTLIIGAGASKALFPNFGTGNDLLNDIVNRVSDSNPNSQYLRQVLLINGYSEEELNHFKTDIQNYLQFNSNKSIDSFLDEYNVFPEFRDRKTRMIEIGRHLITAHVVGWEGAIKNTVLRNDEPNWLTHIFDFIKHYNLRRAYNNSATIHIVNFNYDRIIEHFLHEEDLREHNKYRQEYHDFLNKSLYHVYGVLGNTEVMYPYRNGQEKVLPFGNDNNVLLNDRVFYRTMFEDRQNNENVFSKCRLALRKSKTIAIMGFGFDEFNCKNIGLDDNLGASRVDNRLLHVHFYEESHPRNHHTINLRRENIRKIRRIYPDVKFYFGSMLDFVKEVFVLN